MLKEKIKKIAVGTGTVATVLTATGLTPFAAGSSAEVTTALTTVAGDVTATLASVAPIGLTIAGTFLVWRYGMKFFKSLSK